MSSPQSRPVQSRSAEQPSGSQLLGDVLATLVDQSTPSLHASDAVTPELRSQRLEEVLALMPRFDLGDWSACDTAGNRASFEQHERHIRLLARLSQQTGDQRVLGWHDRFVEYHEIQQGKVGKLELPWKSGQPAGDNYYGRVARSYLAQRAHQPIWLAEQSAVAHFLDLMPRGQSVLDVPFGTGRFVPLYIERAMAVTGIDISSDMLAEARRALGPLGEEVTMLRGDAASLPFSDQSFDGVVAMRFLESIIPFAMVRPVLTEFRRVCRSWAIVRLNSRAAELPPLASLPDGAGIMGTSLNLTQLQQLCCECGWQLNQSLVVGQRAGAMKGEQRVCFLRAID